MDELMTGGAGIAGSIIGGLAAFFGVKNRIERLEKKIDNELICKSECIAHKETQKQINMSQDQRISDIKEVLNEVREDVKYLVRNSPKRRDD